MEIKKKYKKRKKSKKEKKESKKEKKEKRNLFLVVLDKICVFCLYPIPDSQQYVKRGSCRRLILSELLCLFSFWTSGPFVTSFEFGPRTLSVFIESSSRFSINCLFYFYYYHLSLNVMFLFISLCHIFRIYLRQLSFYLIRFRK